MRNRKKRVFLKQTLYIILISIFLILFGPTVLDYLVNFEPTYVPLIFIVIYFIFFISILFLLYSNLDNPELWSFLKECIISVVSRAKKEAFLNLNNFVETLVPDNLEFFEREEVICVITIGIITFCNFLSCLIFLFAVNIVWNEIKEFLYTLTSNYYFVIFYLLIFK